MIPPPSAFSFGAFDRLVHLCEKPCVRARCSL